MLTTMHIPMREIGAAALGVLMEDLGVASLRPRRVELACALVERQSVGPPVDAATHQASVKRRYAQSLESGPQGPVCKPVLHASRSRMQTRLWTIWEMAIHTVPQCQSLEAFQPLRISRHD
jgi:hypothetical protein